MPLSEFHPSMRAKIDSSQSKSGNSLTDLPLPTSDDDFMELLWENGQIVMQGQSSRSKKNTFPGSFASHSIKVPEKEERDAAVVASRMVGRCGAADSFSNELSTAGVSDRAAASNPHDDEMVPWLNLPIDDYCLEFLSEFPAPNVNSPPTTTIGTNSPLLADRGSNCSAQVARDPHTVVANVMPKPFTATGSSDPGRIRSEHIPQQWPSLASARNSRAPGSSGTAIGTTAYHTITNWDSPNDKVRKQVLLPSEPAVAPLPAPPPNNSAGLMNFSHFSRPVALLKANLESAERLKSNDKVSTCGSSNNHLESTLIESASGMKSISNVHSRLASGKEEPKSTPQAPKDVASLHSEAINWENDSKHNSITSNRNIRLPGPPTHSCSNLNFKATIPVTGRELEKLPEPAVASSSVCSGNGAGTASNDPKYRAKRKNQEGDESGYNSDDPEDESTGVKKRGTGRGSSAKRSRAAEVHNLSERRRRDRINEKMRALQELIPNCNKVDKASMLDEAIEYLKTLQLQIQIMSMGGGLCMPPMMLPAGMQHMRVPHMAHFPSMGVGMGMGMGLGYGMGMLDVNGSPLIHVPPVHEAQFPSSSAAALPSVPGMPPSTTNLRMYGIPGQGMPLSMRRGPPLFPISVQSTRMSTAPEMSAATAASEQACVNVRERQTHGSSLETAINTEADMSQLQTSTEPKRECYEESSSMQVKNQTSHSSDGNGNSSSGTASHG